MVERSEPPEAGLAEGETMVDGAGGVEQDERGPVDREGQELGSVVRQADQEPGPRGGQEEADEVEPALKGSRTRIEGI